MKKIISSCLIAHILFSSNLFGFTITIPNDYSTIQEGIDNAISGDTILVSPGIYLENINFNGKNVVVASHFLVTNDTAYIRQTIIDGDDKGSVVTFESGEDSTALITGFTIKKCYVISQNGGGIYCINSSPTISYNIIDSNVVDFGMGGGIYMENSSAKVTRNYIKNNSGNYNFRGAAIVCNGGEPFIAYNLIHDNRGDVPSGITALNSARATSMNNTIVNNKSGNYGFGLVCRDSSTINVVNTIIWAHSPQSIDIVDPKGTVNITYSNIEGGWSGMGNIDINPAVVNTSNFNYNLQFGSPCIDTGDPNSPNDLDGTRADMGAFYYDQSTGLNHSSFLISELNIKAYPNPFKTSTTIEFENKNKAKHTLMI